MSNQSNLPPTENVVAFPVNDYIERMQGTPQPANPFGPSGPSGPGDGGGMEARITRLENGLDQVKGDLSGVRVDVAAIKERLNHLPTKEEVRTSIDAAMDKAGGRIQRNVGIIVAIATLVIGGTQFAIKLIAG